MAQQTISKMETVQTAVDYFKDELIKQGFFIPGGIYAQAKAMEKEQRIRDYNAGYTDAQCNHVNDAENYANEQEYLNDKEITDYTISPFGTPEKK